MKGNGIALVVFSLFLAGCNANQDSLEAYISQVEAKARKDVTALAPILAFQIAEYQSHQAREPFVLPKSALMSSQPAVKKDCWQPKSRRKNGKLERYPLQNLRLKGVMSSGGQVSALVQTPAGTVVQVRSGQYIGLNNGRVTRVTPQFLVIKETLPDGLGCWDNRSVKLALK